MPEVAPVIKTTLLVDSTNLALDIVLSLAYRENQAFL
jgi:hypothetical protein